LIAGALAAIGILGFVIALVAGLDQRVWEAYLVNFLFFTGLAQGGVVLSCGYYLTQGRWTRHAVHIRVAEAGWPFLLLAVVLFAGVFIGRDHIFPWIAHPVGKKAAWLNVPFLFARDWIALIVMALMSWWFVAKSRGRAARLWAADPQTIEMPPPAVRRLAPILGILYIYVYTIFAIDLMMSLSPLWHSTLFGWWWFEMCFWSGIAGSALVATYFRRHLGPETAFSDQAILHDYGKLVFAFSIFWIYLGFAQYLVIWFGDLPTETFFLMTRFWHMPWEPLGWLCPILIWVIPFFFLMGVRPKKNPVMLRTVALLGLIGVWLTDYVMVVPSLSPDHLPLGWVELSITAGFLGLFLLCVNPGLRLAARMATGGADGME
ncbi:MAG: hypothetical protein ACREQC_09225, partial [Candidatus Binataceae bacterium]